MIMAQNASLLLHSDELGSEPKMEMSQGDNNE